VKSVYLFIVTAIVKLIWA